MLGSPEDFFSHVRSVFGSLKQSQVDGFNQLITAGCNRKMPRAQLAYVLATAWHETAHTMKPITEYGDKDYFDKYDTGRLAKALGNTPEADDDGYLYRGRGFVQITGFSNYRRFTEVCGVDLVEKPQLALDPKVATEIIFVGMERGLFTGKALSDYIQPPEKQDYVGARRIVNGTDRADKIATHARAFDKALLKGKYEDFPRHSLEKSRTMAETAKQKKTSAVGATLSAGAIAVEVGKAFYGDAQSAAEAAGAGAILAQYAPYATLPIVAVVIGLFVYQRVRAKKIEQARVEDFEAGVR